MTHSSDVSSSAFSFMGFVAGNMDPRTGQYGLSITLPTLLGNDLAGPDLECRLAFSALNTRDSGYGHGWNLNLSQYTPHNQILALSTGETFKVTGSGYQPEIAEKKLDTFHFYDLGRAPGAENRPGFYKVVHKSGLVELLQLIEGDIEGRTALPVQLQSMHGRTLTLSYQVFPGQLILKDVVDEGGRQLLNVVRNNDQLAFNFWPGASEAVTYRLLLRRSDKRVERVSLPSPDNAGWDIHYETFETLPGHLYVQYVRSPSGAEETLNYAGEHRDLRFPGDPNGRAPLRRATSHQLAPGGGQPAVLTRYRYPGGYNFLGYGAQGLAYQDDGLDNLYRVREAYRYSSECTVEEGATHAKAGTTLRTIKRTYNRFHLLVEEVTQQGANVCTQATDYWADESLPFSSQRAYFQMPKKVSKRWSVDGVVGEYFEESETSDYDAHGNLLQTIAADGSRTTFEWYPAEGIVGHCPPDPHQFVRTRRSETQWPAPAEQGNAPTVVTRESYAALPAFAADTPAPLVLTRTRTLERIGTVEHERAQTNFRYHQDRADPLQYGRKKTAGTTLNRRTRSIEYTYGKIPGRAGPTVLLSTERASSDFDALVSQSTRHTSLLNALELFAEDDEGQMVEYRYDALQRLVQEITAPGSAHEASVTYRYGLSTDPNQPAYQEHTNVKGRVTRLVFDGLQRTVAETCIDQTNSAFLGQPRPTYTAAYDALGQLVSETHYDWLGNQQYPLTTLTRYDDWGQPCHTIDPDGLEHFNQQSPTQRTSLTWDYSAADQRKSAQTLVHLNRFDKPDCQQVFAADADPFTSLAPLAKHVWFYDGLGQCTEETELVQDAAQRLDMTTTYTYDFWGRLATSTLPDNSQVEHTYAEHSSEELNVAIAVYEYGREALATPVTLGRRTYDSLDRMTSNTCANRTETLHYQGSEARPQWRETADQQRFDYLYTPELTDAPIQVSVNQQLNRFTYDSLNAQLLTSSDTQGYYTFTYDQHGALAQEQYTAGDNRQWRHDQVNSRLGLLISRSTQGGLETHYEYDRHCRLTGARQGALQATFHYDGFSRLQRSISHNLGSQETVTADLEYDDLGREVLRTTSTPGHPTTVCRQAWRGDNQLISRHLLAGDDTLLLEIFTYDERTRLQTYSASGSDLPKDRYGNALTRQVFAYDSYGNVTTRMTDYSNGSRDIARYEYSDDDRCQLLAVSHSLAPYPARTLLTYDAAGRQEVDLDGRLLAYDERNRLVAVRSPDGQNTLVRYRYDCHDRLIGVTYGEQPETLRFYVGTRVEHSIQAGKQTWYLYNGDAAIGQQHVQAGQPEQALLLLSNANLSVIGELDRDGLRRTTYGAYGESTTTAQHQCTLGFNGEQRELATGWYLLGNGYRAYDPELMRFHCPDNLSPFDAGGLNAYMYCLGNPIGYRDPTGHISSESWTGIGFATLVSLKLVWALKLSIGIILAPATAGLSMGIAVASAVATTSSLLGGAMITAGSIWWAETDERRASNQAKILLGVGIALSIVGLVGMKGASWQQKKLDKMLPLSVESAKPVPGGSVSSGSASSSAPVGSVSPPPSPPPSPSPTVSARPNGSIGHPSVNGSAPPSTATSRSNSITSPLRRSSSAPGTLGGRRSSSLDHLSEVEQYTELKPGSSHYHAQAANTATNSASNAISDPASTNLQKRTLFQSYGPPKRNTDVKGTIVKGQQYLNTLFDNIRDKS